MSSIEGGEIRLTAYEEKQGAFFGMGVLQYASKDKNAAVSTEYAAIIDVSRRLVLGLEFYKQGGAAAEWNWIESGDLVVKGPDLVSTTYRLGRGLATASVATAPAQAPARTWRPPRQPSYQQADAPRPQRRQAAARPPAPVKKKKSFTLFDLLFN